MRIKYSPITEFTPKHSITQGFFQSKIGSIKKIVSFKGSSNGHEKHDIYNVTYQNGKFWESDNKENSTFTINFSKNIIKLNSLSLYSCSSHECTNGFDVSGSNTGDYWEPICSIREENSTFMNKTTNVECKSNFFYKIIQITNIGRNSANNFVFTIHYIELFGMISTINQQFISVCGKAKQFISPISIFIVSLIYVH